MAKPVLMPKQGITVESCVLTKWHKKVGDKIAIGEVLFSYETDKASFDQTSEIEGEVLAQFCADGDEVPVLTNICVIGSKGEDFSAFAPSGAKADAPAAEQKEEIKDAPKSEAAAPAAASAQSTDGFVHASPRAKNLAAKSGVDIAACIPTGPNGRIVESDVRRASVAGKSAADEVQPAAPATKTADAKAFTEEKLPNIRKIIAKNMVASLQTMAQLTHTISYDCTNIMQFRAYLKANAEKLNLPNITINDIIIYSVARVLKNHKLLNANLVNGDTMRFFSSSNIGIAVDTPRGLLVPTLFGADALSLAETAVQAKKLAKDAQSGSISSDLLSGASFTISNLGSFGIESFTPVINPPQTGILGVNTITTSVKTGKNGELVAYQSMNLSLTYDHRALDGAPASRFLKELKEYLENFSYNMIF